MKIAVILPAAGLSKRFNASGAGGAGGSGIDAVAPSASKIELDLVGKPVFLRALDLFFNRPGVGQLILAVNPDAIDDFKFRWSDKLAFHDITIVAGGRMERWETVLKALEAVNPDCTHAAIHDAARPLTSSALIDRVFEAAAKYPAVIPGVPVNATLKRVAEVPDSQETDPLDAILGSESKTSPPIKRVVQTVDRRDLVEVQTPQVFELSLLRRAYAQITSGKFSGHGVTDDAGLVESLGEPVHVVEGESTNLKITRPGDMKLAEAYLRLNEPGQAAALGRKRLFKDEDE